MEHQQKLPIFTFDTFPPVQETPVSHELYPDPPAYFHAPEQHQGSFSQFSTGYPMDRENSSQGKVDRIDGACSPWLPDASSCSSPISTNSTLAHSERAITPSYSNQLPFHMEYTLETPMSQCSNAPTGHAMWIDNHEHNWQRKYSQGEAWMPPAHLPSWSGSSYDHLHVPGSGFSFSSESRGTAPPMLYPVPLQYPNNQLVDSAPFKQESFHSSSGEGDSDDDSDSGIEDSEANHASVSHQKFSTSYPRIRRRVRQATPPVLKLGKWSEISDPYAQVEPRHYICPYASKVDVHGQKCDQRFNRPEHLRRHVKTKHGNEKEYMCKVPDCHTAFSRGDNLRDHYWTHLYRGGRRGKNKKMTLEELKEILGPKEKKLVKRLKEKLRKYRQKHWTNL